MRNLTTVLLFAIALNAQAGDVDPLKQVFTELETKAASGDAEAMESLAFYYENGIATPRDDGKALDLHTRAAAIGSVRAMESLGGIYGQRGLDYESLRWYEKAAKHGGRWAMFRLGIAYQKGLGTQPDPQRARQNLEQAAALGVDKAQMYIGSMYFQGDLYPQNSRMAYAWLSVASANNSEHSSMRDTIAETLAPDELVEAQDMALVIASKLANP